MNKYCFMCSEKIRSESYAEFLDGRYKVCENCCDEVTEVMDEIDEARRSLKMDLDYLKRMVRDALAFDDPDYARGVLERSLDWVGKSKDDRYKEIVNWAEGRVV